MFCPKCRSEYRPGFTECAECKVPLVHELAPDPDDARREEPLNLVTILTTSDPAILAIAKSILATEAIPFVVKNEEGTVLRPLPTAFPTEVQVREEDAERAAELLAEPLRGAAEDPAE